MRTFLYTVLACAAMVALVPLFVLAASGGNWRHALHALREYLVAMGILVVLGGGAGVLAWLTGHW